MLLESPKLRTRPTMNWVDRPRPRSSNVAWGPADWAATTADEDILNVCGISYGGWRKQGWEVQCSIPGSMINFIQRRVWQTFETIEWSSIIKRGEDGRGVTRLNEERGDARRVWRWISNGKMKEGRCRKMKGLTMDLKMGPCQIHKFWPGSDRENKWRGRKSISDWLEFPVRRGPPQRTLYLAFSIVLMILAHFNLK